MKGDTYTGMSQEKLANVGIQSVPIDFLPKSQDHDCGRAIHTVPSSAHFRPRSQDIGQRNFGSWRDRVFLYFIPFNLM
jgi:hypothetical protein